MTTRSEIPAQDALWLDLERPNALMVVDALLWFDEPPDWDKLLEVVQNKLADRFPAMRRRVVSEHPQRGPVYWEDDPSFDPEQHVVRARLPEPGDIAALQSYVAAARSQPLDPQRPLWQVHLVSGLGEGGAVLFRVHHVIADGIRVSQLVMSLCDDARGRPLIPVPSTESADLVSGVREGFKTGATRSVGEISAIVAEVADQMSSSAGALVERVAEAVANPTGAVSGAVSTARDRAGGAALVVRDAWSDATDLRLVTPSRFTDYFAAVRANAGTVRSLLFSANDPTVWTGSAGIEKRVAWSEAIPMREIRRVAVRTGTSVPDVVIASLAGAVQRYTVEHDAPVSTVTWLLPVPVRPFGDALPRELGSLFALLPFEMPADMDDAVPRLAEISARLAELNSGPTALLAFGLAYLIPYVHGGQARAVMERGAARSAGLLTNLPGPRRPAYLAGTRVTGVMGFAPTAGDQALSVSLVSYDGSLRIGVATDAGLVPDPATLAEYTATAFGRLREDLQEAENVLGEDRDPR